MVDTASLLSPTLRNSILGNADALLIDTAEPQSHADGVLNLDGLLGLAGGSDQTDGQTAVPNVQAADILGPASAGLTNLGLNLPGFETVANDAILALHYDLEVAGHQINAPNAVHGLTNLGETIGLGKIGESNLLTDAINTPTDLLSGDTSHVTHIPADIGAVVSAAEGFVDGVVTDVDAGGIVPGVLANGTQVVGDLAAYPAAGIANEAVSALHTALEGTFDPILPNTIHGVTGLGNTVGLGEIGGSNLVTDVLQTPGALLAGDTTPASHIIGDVGNIVESAGNLVTGIGEDLGHSPITGAVSGAIADVGPAIGGLGLGGLGTGGLGTGGLGTGGLGTGGVGGLLSGTDGSAGTHDLVTVAVGPQSSPGGLQIDVLSTSTNQPAHLVDVHAITVPDAVPSLANVSVLPDTLHIPTGLGGGDALAGAFAPQAAAAQPAAPAAAAPVPAADPVLHLDPLAGLGHAIHHA